MSAIEETGGQCAGRISELREAVKEHLSKKRKDFWLGAAIMAVVAVSMALSGRDVIGVVAMAVGISLIVQALMQSRSLKDVDALDADALVAKAKELHYEVLLGKKQHLRNAMLAAILFVMCMLFEAEPLSAKNIVGVLASGLVFFLLFYFVFRKSARKPLVGADKRIADLLEQL